MVGDELKRENLAWGGNRFCAGYPCKTEHFYINIL